MAERRAPAAESQGAERRLASFIDKFSPAHQQLIRAARRALQTRYPTANEIAYDNYNFFVIGYGATERPSDCFLSLTAAASGVGLCFVYGASLPDPDGILLGSGRQTRFIRLASVAVLDRPEVASLLRVAAEQARAVLPAEGHGRPIIRAVSAKQRKRRKEG